MKKDFYQVLGIKRIASDEQISNRYSLYGLSSYKRLALKHHPMKNPSAMAMNTDAFHQICEAYEVLSNRKFLFIFSSPQGYLRPAWRRCAKRRREGLLDGR